MKDSIIQQEFSIWTDQPQTKPSYPKEVKNLTQPQGTVLIPTDQQQTEINGF